MPLSQWQIEELAKIIRLHVDYFSWSIYGPEVLTPEMIKDIEESGIFPPGFPIDIIKYNFVLGRLESLMTGPQFEAFTWPELQAEAEKWTPTTLYESKAIEEARAAAGLNVQRIGDDIKNGLYDDLQTLLQRQVSESTVQGIIQDVVAHGIEERKTVRQVASRLADALAGTPAQEYLRTAATEMHNARIQGYLSALLQGEGKFEDLAEGLDSQVFVDTVPGACKECVEAYVDPKTGHPRIFRLGDILANGTNVGIPKKLRNKGTTGPYKIRATIPPHHPYCFCDVQFMPPGWGFNKEGEMELQQPSEAYKELLAT